MKPQKTEDLFKLVELGKLKKETTFNGNPITIPFVIGKTDDNGNNIVHHAAIHGMLHKLPLHLIEHITLARSCNNITYTPLDYAFTNKDLTQLTGEVLDKCLYSAYWQTMEGLKLKGRVKNNEPLKRDYTRRMEIGIENYLNQHYMRKDLELTDTRLSGQLMTGARNGTLQEMWTDKHPILSKTAIEAHSEPHSQDTAVHIAARFQKLHKLPPKLLSKTYILDHKNRINQTPIDVSIHAVFKLNCESDLFYKEIEVFKKLDSEILEAYTWKKFNQKIDECSAPRQIFIHDDLNTEQNLKISYFKNEIKKRFAQIIVGKTRTKNNLHKQG
jgi:hypothetical protein